MEVGDAMVWLRVCSNYGHTESVPVVVRRIGKRVTVEVLVELRATNRVYAGDSTMIGKRVAVKAESLRAVALEATP